ncbi:unnamed protein product [Caenorhabditis bovis]|uniref:Uncharacterized protein n=1 Tax=Caenorhabditis bovis TaxID=2654633 RepID=A0A8S1EUF2_9PELO|nr:unnamed protein product [Caenorhabditis bovis]
MSIHGDRNVEEAQRTHQELNRLYEMGKQKIDAIKLSDVVDQKNLTSDVKEAQNFLRSMQTKILNLKNISSKIHSQKEKQNIDVNILSHEKQLNMLQRNLRDCSADVRKEIAEDERRMLLQSKSGKASSIGDGTRKFTSPKERANRLQDLVARMSDQLGQGEQAMGSLVHSSSVLGQTHAEFESQAGVIEGQEKPQISVRELISSLAELLRENNDDDAKRFLTRNPSIIDKTDDSGRSTVHFAAVGGCLPILQFAILNNPEDATKTDDIGWSPLMIASSAGRANIVSYLLSLPEVDVKHANKNGQTSLHYAASRNHIDIVKLLVASDDGCLNLSDKYGATALHRAASQGHEVIVRYLLSQPKIRIDPRDSEGNTPLHLACDEDRQDVAIMLASRGASIELKNKEEKTPLDFTKTSEFRLRLKNAAK